MNFYNEIDPAAAAWLRELIKAGHIAPGVVDERSIEDIAPHELKQYTQCHFFAGIGVWSYALRRAGWPDDRPVWTGSCPCQPFSTAGKRTGTADERHLWPAFFHLISECRPNVVLGEQVEAAIRQGWLDLIQADLEGIGYSFGASGLPAAGFGAPHIRSRLYFVADSADVRRDERRDASGLAVQGQRAIGSGQHAEPEREGELARGLEGLRGLGRGKLGDPSELGRGTRRFSESGVAQVPTIGSTNRNGVDAPSNACGVALGDTFDAGLEGLDRDGDNGDEPKRFDSEPFGPARETSGVGPTGGFWGDADWIYCRDEKYRAVEPGSFPLAHGSPARVGRLRGYGNAIVAPVAEAFIRAAIESGVS